MAARPKTTSGQYEHLSIFENPMCLITTPKQEDFKIEEEALKQIESINCPLVVVAIAGLYRTGKSYLMNRIAGVSKGFPLGNTIQSKTKGIWAWCKPHPSMENTVLLLLDTEGLGDISKGDIDHDNKIFSLAALLCNVLVYNIMSAFNQDAIEKLTFITEISKNIQFKNKSDIGLDDEQLDLILPSFVLCLRDFILDLEIDGEEISADDYLEHCLELKPGRDSSSEKYNRPRECIRKYFKRRKCFTFDRPGDRKIMKQLETTEEEDLSKSFREDTLDFLQHIYSHKPKVLLTSRSLTGPMFATLVVTYVKAIRDGVIPDVDDAITMVANAENERLAAGVMTEFEKQLQHVSLPVLQNKELEAHYHGLQETSLAKFRAEAMFNSEKNEKRVIDEMAKLWSRKNEENLNLVRKHCEECMRKMYATYIGSNVKENKYMVPGGYTLYKADMETLKIRYKLEMKGIDEIEVQNVFNVFIEKNAVQENEILISDQQLTAEDRKQEIERLYQENKEERDRQQALFEKNRLEERKRNEDHMKTIMAERKEYDKREEQKMKVLLESWKTQQEFNAGQMKMMKEENEKQKETFREEMQRMRADYDKRQQLETRRFDEIVKQVNEANQSSIERLEQAHADHLFPLKYRGFSRRFKMRFDELTQLSALPTLEKIDKREYPVISKAMLKAFQSGLNYK